MGQKENKNSGGLLDFLQRTIKSDFLLRTAIFIQ